MTHRLRDFILPEREGGKRVWSRRAGTSLYLVGGGTEPEVGDYGNVTIHTDRLSPSVWNASLWDVAAQSEWVFTIRQSFLGVHSYLRVSMTIKSSLHIIT